ncbi:MAG: zinc-binding dehydrogenase [Deltaproteobacteria bacterium]|nr:zinc-binding dehydrogenase [Deltaproteobacteria bacterium]
MPEKGRAAIFREAQKPMEIREFDAPEPKEGELLVRNLVANICGSDLHIWLGHTPIGTQLKMDMVLGHEMVSRVVKSGKGRSRDALGRSLKEGDRVVFAYYKPCGHCYACLDGAFHTCEISLNTVFMPVSPQNAFVGGYADYYLISPKQVVLKVPDELGDDEVAGVNCALSQVIHGLLDADLRFGETVVIQGAGGLGQYATAVAREMGASRVIVIDGIDSRIDMAKKMGADAIIDIRQFPDGQARVKEIKKLTDNWGADLVVEVVGIPDVMPEGVRMMGRRGRYLTMGNVMPRASYKEDPSILVGGNRSILGRSLYPASVLRKALDFLVRAKNRYPFSTVPVHYPLEKINDAFSDAETFGKSHKDITRAAIKLAA